MIGWIDAGLGGVTAGFTTRDGGVSSAPYESLNLGLNVGDAPDAVMANRRAVGEHVGAPVAFAHQVHGSTVVEVTSPAAAASAAVGDADVLLTQRDDVAIAVLWADCVPVLLVDPERRVVAAAHAGRAGLVGGAVSAAVEAMVALGCSPQAIRAAIGPCIRPEHYEVPSELRDEVDAAVPGTAAVTSWGSPAVDLAAGVAAVLRRCGVSAVVDLRLSTWPDERFFSHRRSGGEPTGRGAAVIRLLPPGRVLPGVGADAG